MDAAEDIVIGKIQTGERDYERAVAFVIAHAEKDLKVFDPDLSRGNFKSLAIAEAIQHFLAGGVSRRLQIVVHDASFYHQHCVRLAKLYAIYAHQMDILVTDVRAHIAQDAMVIADAKHYLHRFHIHQARFKVIFNDGVSTRALLERYQEIVEAAPHRLSSTTLGL